MVIQGEAQVSDFKFNIGDTEFTIQDLGSSLNQEFIHLHEHFLKKKPFNSLQLEKSPFIL